MTIGQVCVEAKNLPNEKPQYPLYHYTHPNSVLQCVTICDSIFTEDQAAISYLNVKSISD